MSWGLFVLLLVLLIAALPRYPYSMNWGYYPSGILFILAIVILFLILTGRSPF
jgi:hypothetical protein